MIYMLIKWPEVVMASNLASSLSDRVGSQSSPQLTGRYQIIYLSVVDSMGVAHLKQTVGGSFGS